MTTFWEQYNYQKKPQKKQKNFLKENIKQIKIIECQRHWDEYEVNKPINEKKKYTSKKRFATQHRKLTNVLDNTSSGSEKDGGSIKDVQTFQLHPITPPTLVSDSAVQGPPLGKSNSSGRSTSPVVDASCQTDRDMDVKLNNDRLRSPVLTAKEGQKNKEEGGGDTDTVRVKPGTPQSQGKKGFVDYVKLNIIRQYKDKKPKEEKPDPTRPPPSYQKGVVPKYLREKNQIIVTNSILSNVIEDTEKVKEEDKHEIPPGYVLMSDEDRKGHLRIIRENYAEMIRENAICIKSDSLKNRQRRLEIEGEIEKLEQGIQLFSRQKLYVKLSDK